MTKFSKVLVVITAVACLVWLGFVLIALAGGPNWGRIAQDLSTEYGYEFALTEGESPVWTAKRGGTTTSLASDANLAKVIVAVQNDIKSQQAAILNGNPAQAVPGLQDQIDQLNKQIAEARQTGTTDVAAMEAYEQRLVQDLTAIEQQIEQTGEQIVEATKLAKGKQDEATLRRGDVHRLRQLLQELEAERDRLTSLQPALRNWIQQGQADVRALERRAEGVGIAAGEPARPDRTTAGP